MKHVLQPFPKHLQTLHQVDSEATIEQLWKVRRKKGQFEKIPKELVNAIEKLRQAVEKIALEVCF